MARKTELVSLVLWLSAYSVLLFVPMFRKYPALLSTAVPMTATDEPDAPPWADLWGGPPFVVYGHTPRPEIYKLKWSIGIDTGCVLGGYLTAYILPERRTVQVKARQRYFP